MARPEDGKLREEKVIHGTEDDNIQAKCFMEIQEAMKNKDAGAFGSALEAMILNLFQEDGDAFEPR